MISFTLKPDYGINNDSWILYLHLVQKDNIELEFLINQIVKYLYLNPQNITKIYINKEMAISGYELTILKFLRELVEKFSKIKINKKKIINELKRNGDDKLQPIKKMMFLFLEQPIYENILDLIKNTLYFYKIIQTSYPQLVYSWNMIKKFKNKIDKSSFFKDLVLKFNVNGISNIDYNKLFPNISQYLNSRVLIKEKTRKIKIGEYEIFHKLFRILIYDEFIGNVKKKKLNTEINLPQKLINQISIWEQFLQNKNLTIPDNYIFNIEKKILSLQDIIFLILENFIREFEKNIILDFSFILSISLLKIKNLFPLLVDPYIEEIFLDSINENIYLNHQKYGRIETDIFLAEDEITALTTHLILESNKPLNEERPSLIHAINNKFFHCRFSIDITPSHWKNISIDIRKLKKNILTLNDLINLKTLSFEMGSFLIFSLLLKINITIFGEVNSGKTTLLNALDLFIPSHYRKIYVEDVIETLDFPSNMSHQLKFIPKKDDIGESDKSKEIIKLLHRSGDYIILGEILSEKDTKAFFHCISAGLNGLQTTHAENIQGLINRWTIHYNIDKSLLNDLGIIVYMKKLGINRKVLSIMEVEYSPQKGNIELREFFKYDSLKENWCEGIGIKNFEQTLLFRKLKSFTFIPKTDLLKILTTIKEILLNNHQNGNKKIFGIIDDNLSNLQKYNKYLGGL